MTANLLTPPKELGGVIKISLSVWMYVICLCPLASHAARVLKIALAVCNQIFHEMATLCKKQLAVTPCVNFKYLSTKFQLLLITMWGNGVYTSMFIITVEFLNKTFYIGLN